MRISILFKILSLVIFIFLYSCSSKLSNGVLVQKKSYKKDWVISSSDNSKIAVQSKKTESSKVFIKTFNDTPEFVSNLNSNRAESKKISFKKKNNKKLMVSKLNTIANYFEPGGKCDEIIFKNGEKLMVKILEINQRKIVYKKCDNLTGQSYTKSKTDVFMVSYSDGTKDVFVSDEKYIPLMYGGVGLLLSTLLPIPFLGVILGCIGLYKYRKNPEKSTTLAKVVSIIAIILNSLISLFVLAYVFF